jgi:toxin ParE1/3/4
MVKLVWTELSQYDLEDIFDYIAKDSKRYASITVNKIYQRAQEVIENPLIGRIVPEFGSKSIRELISGNYRIIYRIVSDKQVDILRVYHSSRLLKKNRLT